MNRQIGSAMGIGYRVLVFDSVIMNRMSFRFRSDNYEEKDTVGFERRTWIRL